MSLHDNFLYRILVFHTILFYSKRKINNDNFLIILLSKYIDCTDEYKLFQKLKIVNINVSWHNKFVILKSNIGNLKFGTTFVNSKI